jgi:hypothetical protein
LAGASITIESSAKVTPEEGVVQMLKKRLTVERASATTGITKTPRLPKTKEKESPTRVLPQRGAKQDIPPIAVHPTPIAVHPTPTAVNPTQETVPPTTAATMAESIIKLYEMGPCIEIIREATNTIKNRAAETEKVVENFKDYVRYGVSVYNEKRLERKMVFTVLTLLEALTNIGGQKTSTHYRTSLDSAQEWAKAMEALMDKNWKIGGELVQLIMTLRTIQMITMGFLRHPVYGFYSD